MERIHRFLDRLPRTSFGRGSRVVPASRTCGIAGYYLAVATTLYVRALGEPVLPYLDAAAAGMCFFLAAGRVGCTLVNCCHGRPSAFGITYGEDCARDELRELARESCEGSDDALPRTLTSSAGVTIAATEGEERVHLSIRLPGRTSPGTLGVQLLAGASGELLFRL